MWKSAPQPMMNNLSLLLLCLVTVTGAAKTWPLDWDFGGWGFGAWASHSNPSVERQDEVNDDAILKAVITSMVEWEKTRKDPNRVKRADSSVCYSNIGCFMGSSPFSYLGVLPASPSEVGTSFHFFSPREPHRARSLSFEDILVPGPEAAPLLQQQSVRGRRDNAAVDKIQDSSSEDSANSTTSTTSTTTMSSTSKPDASISINAANLDSLAQLDSALSLGFNSTLPTKMIVHGFGSSCSLVWVQEMRSALMAVEECNVICVDWESGASIPNYVRAAANTRLVGKQVALLLKKLMSKYSLDPKKVHLIGFSLGAHVAGFAGAETPGLSRITGLDPAGPLFESQAMEARLDASDAQFVDVIHSNGANLIMGGLGSWQAMGHVDFYPNGGMEQKGCSNLLLGAVSDISMLWSSSEGDSRSLCNHRRAYKFFTDSVSSKCPFPAFPCESYEQFLEGECFNCGAQRQCGNMGYYSNRSPARGPLFLITRDNEPFCAHQFFVRVDSTPSAEPLTTNGRFEVVLASKELNETFALTEKEDDVMETGESMYRLLVAHPVMAQPTSAQLVYTAYSGWISSGTSTWTVDKVLVTDAFGKSVSFCKKGMILSSGVPLLVPLFPGDCNPPKAPGLDYPVASSTHVNNDFPTNASGEESGNKAVSMALESSADNGNKTGIDITISLLNKNESSTTDANQTQENTSTTTEYPLYQRPWLDTNNSLDARLDNSRSLPQSESRKRSFANVSEPPPPPSPSAGSWSFWWRSANRTEPPLSSLTNSSSGTLVTVQMLPKKLASILQQAEQYARSTLSSVTSTLIGGKELMEPLFVSDRPVRRRAKYFPPLTSLFGYESKEGRQRPPESTFSPMQIINNPEWRLSRYIPLRRFSSEQIRRSDDPVTPSPSTPLPSEEEKAHASVTNKIESLLPAGPR